MGEGLNREEKAPSAKPRLGTPEVRGTTLSTHFVLCGILASTAVSRWTGRVAEGGGPLGVGAVTSSFGTSYLGCQAQTWTKRWAVACFPCRNPGCQGFCNVYTRNQFGKVIHTEQESQKAPWKSSRVTPSSARHRHRLADCTTVKPGLAVSGSVSPSWSTCFLEVQAGRGLDHTTLLYWV